MKETEQTGSSITTTPGGGGYNRNYDLIVPLGNNCSTAWQLKNVDLRRLSCPFDWLFAEDDEALAQACELLETHFEKFLLEENLTRRPASEKDHKKNYVYYDEGSRRLFLHDFPKAAFQDSVKVTQEKYARRINRLYDYMAKSDAILFVYTALNAKQATKEQLTRAYERLCKVVGPGKRVDLFVMKYGSNKTKDDYLDGNEHIFVSEDARAFSDLFINHFSPLAAFLLTVHLSRKVVSGEKKPTYLSSIFYRLNKYTSKWLQKRGYKVPHAAVFN